MKKQIVIPILLIIIAISLALAGSVFATSDNGILEDKLNETQTQQNIEYQNEEDNASHEEIEEILQNLENNQVQRRDPRNVIVTIIVVITIAIITILVTWWYKTRY